MNYQLAVAGGLTVLALFAHVFGGIRQSLSVEPAKLADQQKLANFETLDRNWVQSMCAFQLVTVDLLERNRGQVLPFAFPVDFVILPPHVQTTEN